MSISPIQSTKPHTARKVAGTALTAAALAGTVLYLAKTGKLNAVEGGNKYLEKAKSMLKKPADFVNGKIAEGIKALQNNEKIGKKLVQAQKYTREALDKVKSNPQVAKAKNVAEAKGKEAVAFAKTIPGRLEKVVDTARDFVESKINPEKFV